MHEEGYSGVVNEVEGLFRGGIRGHDNYWTGVERCGGEVGIVHKGYVREQGIACCEM